MSVIPPTSIGAILKGLPKSENSSLLRIVPLLSMKIPGILIKYSKKRATVNKGRYRNTVHETKFTIGTMKLSNSHVSTRKAGVP